MIKCYISQLTLYSFFHRQNTEYSSETALPVSINAFSIRRKLSIFWSVKVLSTKLFVVLSFIYSFKTFIIAVKTVEVSVLKNLMHIQLESVLRCVCKWRSLEKLNIIDLIKIPERNRFPLDMLWTILSALKWHILLGKNELLIGSLGSLKITIKNSNVKTMVNALR